MSRSDPQADHLSAVIKPERAHVARNGIPQGRGYTYRGEDHDPGYKAAMARLRAVRALITERMNHGS